MEIKLKNISYIYNPNTKLEKEVLKNINIVFNRSKINTIISKSGDGKTTLMELIAGLTIPTNGLIKYSQKRLLAPKIGLVFKNPEEQFFKKTVKQEMEFAIKYLPKINRLEKIKQYLEIVGLDNSYLNKDPFKLSKGEMKKLAIACILIYNPKVILFDEPTIGLDDRSKDNLITLLRKLKEKKKTIIIASRDTDFINRIADYIYVLNKGKLVLEGNKYEVLTNNILVEMNIELPKIIEFSKLVNSKNIKLSYHDDIKDLMKDIYRHVT